MRSSHGIRIGVIGRLSDHKFKSKVRPLFLLEIVERIYLFRHRGNPVKEAEAKVRAPLAARVLPRRVYDLCCLCYFAWLCLFRKIDILIGVYFYPHGLFAGLLGRIFAIPVIQILPGTDLARYLDRRRFERVMKSASAIGLRGEISRQQLADTGIPLERLFILNNVFEPPGSAVTLLRYKKNYDLVTTCYLGQLKRVDITLRVIASLKNDFPEIKCLIIGDGPELANLKALTVELDVEENITFYGQASDVLSLLPGAKIFIMTSESEGLPMAVVEAMVCGLPAVVPKINDIPTVVKDGVNGFLIDGWKVASYKSVCKKLLCDDALRASMADRAHQDMKKLCENDYSFDAVSEVWRRVLTGGLPIIVAEGRDKEPPEYFEMDKAA